MLIKDTDKSRQSIDIGWKLDESSFISGGSMGAKTY
jgi:hypothetical protein